MSFTKTTEQSSKYNHLEKMSISEIVTNINSEDKSIPLAIEKVIPEIENLIQKKPELSKTVQVYYDLLFGLSL